MQDTAAMVYETNDIRFDWHGGAYIQMYVPGEEVPFDVINVWDYAKNEPRIARTLDAFQARCDEWVAEQDEDEE